jgi:bacterial/archaeal transporter family-2 protein
MTLGIRPATVASIGGTMVWLVILMVAAGCASAIQAGANAELRKSLDQSLPALLIVYGSAVLVLLLALPLVRVADLGPSKLARVPWWAWFGGLLSMVSTVATLVLAKRMGSLFFTAATVTCTLLCSVLLDHLGWVGFTVHPLNPGRVIGCVFLMAGVFLVSKF